MKKRILSMLLAIVMVIGMIPVIASAEAATPKITQVSMTLNGVLDVNFKVASNGADMSKASVAITGAAAQTVGSYTREGDLYVYTAKVPAHKLPEALSVELMYDGASVQSATWTAWDSYLSKLTGNEQALAAALNSYGTYAAAYAKGEAGTAISGVTAEQLAAYKPVITVNNGALGAVAALYIDDAADLLVKFNESAWQEGYQLVIDGKNANVVSDGNGKLVYTKEGLLPQSWSHMYDIQVVSGEETVYQVSYGVYSYIRAALKKAEEAAPGLNNLLKSMNAYGNAAAAYQPSSKNPIALGSISLRDPFILNDGDAYYLYGTGSEGKLNVWSSTDLNYWYNEGACLTLEPGDAYYDTTNSEIAFWAPEVFAYNGAYYMFATFTQAGTGNMQGTAILKADSPVGPFTKWSDGFVTPAGHSALDGTLYIENGTPYMIYCHEWQCSCLSGTGTVDYIQLSADLKSTVGNSAQLFTANQFSWGNIWNKKYSTVTDGVHVYTKDGVNYLQWSTDVNGNYTVSYTTFETLAGGISGTHTKLYEDNGGHGMIFTDMNGVDKLVLHTPNSGAAAYPAIFNVSVSDSKLVLEGVHLWNGFGLAQAQVNGTKVYNAESTLFIGDSFFDPNFWTNFAADLNGKDARILGIGSTRAVDWVNYMQSGAILGKDGTAPRNIVINIGNNDAYSDLDQATVISDMQEMLTVLKTNYPSTNLYLFSITPRTNQDYGASTAATQKVEAINSAMEAWCGNNGVTYLNIYSQLSGESMLKDGIHPKDEYYNSVFLAALTAAGCQIADFVGESETLPVHSGAIVFDKYDGSYAVPETVAGSAMTSKNYKAVELKTDYFNGNWPIMGFQVGNGTDTVAFRFCSNEYDFWSMAVLKNGAETGESIACGSSTLWANTKYTLVMSFDGTNVNIYYENADGSRTRVNNDPIALANYLTYDAAVGISVGVYCGTGYGETVFSNITVTESIVTIPDILPVHSGNVTYDEVNGRYTMGSGEATAMTADAYEAVELIANFCPEVWPVQGFAVKQGDNTVGFKFGSEGYDTNHIMTYVNGTRVSTDPATAFAFSLVGAYSYNIKLVYDSVAINMYLYEDGAWKRINAAPINLETLIGSYDRSQGVSVGIAGFQNCGRSFDNVTVTEIEPANIITYAGVEGISHNNPVSYYPADAESITLAAPNANKTGYNFAGWYIGETQVTTLAGQTGDITVTARWEEIVETIPQVLSVTDGATYDKYTGVYAIPTGTALTAESYQSAVLEATFVTDGWPIQGFAWKQGDNVVSAQFGSCGYNTDNLKIFVNGSEVGSVTAINSSLNANTRYTMRMLYSRGRVEIMMLRGDSYVLVNTATISLSSYITGFNAATGVQVGVIGYSTCGASFADVSVTSAPSNPDLLSVKSGATYNSINGVYTIPEGSALTSASYTKAELTTTFMTAGWPIQGFAWKQGDNTVSVKFGSCGYDNTALAIYVNGSNVGSVAAINSSLNANTSYDMKMVLSGQYANIFMKVDGAWMRINTASIDLAAYFGSSYDASAGVQIGVMGYSGCGDRFGNIAIQDSVSIADVLSVKDGATFDAVSGLYNIPSGTALTADSYTSVDLRARFVTAGWPIQGFAWKQGDNLVTAQFGSCGYDADNLKIFVNGSQIATIGASNSSLNGNTAYNMKMTFDGQYANIYMQINGTWTQINTSAIDIAGYMGSSYNASAGVQVGVKGYSGCGDSFDSITVLD